MLRVLGKTLMSSQHKSERMPMPLSIHFPNFHSRIRLGPMTQMISLSRSKSIVTYRGNLVNNGTIKR